MKINIFVDRDRFKVSNINFQLIKTLLHSVKRQGVTLRNNILRQSYEHSYSKSELNAQIWLKTFLPREWKVVPIETLIVRIS
jgi:hypothetical protein